MILFHISFKIMFFESNSLDPPVAWLGITAQHYCTFTCVGGRRADEGSVVKMGKIQDNMVMQKRQLGKIKKAM